MNQENKKNHHKNGEKASSHFPITKPGLGISAPKFPYVDRHHYVDPSSDTKKQCQLGNIAQHALNKPHQNHFSQCHSPELPTSHPWFEPPSSP